MIYPKVLMDLIEYFKKLPGIGEKSAERMALALLDINTDDVSAFADAMCNAKLKLHPCPICGCLTELEICPICSSESRDSNIICVLEDYKGVFAFEKTGKFNGKYHVLNGLISPIDDIGPEDINIFGLIERIKDMSAVELIIALKPSIEGETTTLYLKKTLEKYPNVKISRLSYGIPMGVDIDYLDELTLLNALSERKNIT
mgnify:FL=1